MQVSQVMDTITHAVIGGHAPIEMSVDNSAAIMELLSKSIYSRPKEAVVREILCNGWDSHIRSGKTDVPLKVTLTTDKLTIRDFGTGIDPSRIKELYGTYGGSDKQTISGETGGFGLGAMAPFAYVDHFQMINHFGGQKTIYAISKSSADIAGKRGIQPIVTVPTTETGVEVSLDLQHNDRHEFEQLIWALVRNGEMLVELNGTLIKGLLPLEKSPHGWLITSLHPVDPKERICVRYGNVVYPVGDHPTYAEACNRIRKNLLQHGESLVVLAPADSISVTPSRESLQMGARTLATLKQLLEGFVQQHQQEFHAACLTLLKQGIQEAKASKNLAQLLTPQRGIPGTFFGSKYVFYKSPTFISSFRELAEDSLKRGGYPEGVYKRDMLERLQAAIELAPSNKGTLQSLRKVLQQKLQKKAYINWYRRRVARPLLRDLARTEDMEASRLFVFERSHAYQEGLPTSRAHNHPLAGYNVLAPANYMPLLRKIVLITFARTNVKEQLDEFPDINKLGGKNSVFVYHAPMSKPKLEGIRKFFQDRGFTIIDRTQAQAWRQPTVRPKTNDTPRPKRPKLEGYPSLAGAKHPTHGEYRIDYAFKADAPRITAPVCYFKTWESRATNRHLELGIFNYSDAEAIVEYFGAGCALVVSDAQVKKLEESGIPPLIDYVHEVVLKAVVTSPAFLAFWEQSIERALGFDSGICRTGYVGDDVYQFGFVNQEVRKALGLTALLSLQEQLLHRIWYKMSRYGDTRKGYDKLPLNVSKACAIIGKLSISPLSKSIADRVRANGMSEVLIQALDRWELTNALRSSKPDPEAIKRIAAVYRAVFIG